MIEVQVTAALSSDLLKSNYVGQLARARLVKQTLDDQVVHTYTASLSYEIISANNL